MFVEDVYFVDGGVVVFEIRDVLWIKSIWLSQVCLVPQSQGSVGIVRD